MNDEQKPNDEIAFVGAMSGHTNAQRELIALAIEGSQRNLMSKSDSLVTDGDRIEGVADELIVDDHVAVRTSLLGVGRMSAILVDRDVFDRHAKVAAAIRRAGMTAAMTYEQILRRQRPENELGSFMIFDEVSNWPPEKTIGVLKPDPKWKPWMKFQGPQKPRRK